VELGYSHGDVEPVDRLHEVQRRAAADALVVTCRHDPRTRDIGLGDGAEDADLTPDRVVAPRPEVRGPRRNT
jgi:hypothetical protein